MFIYSLYIIIADNHYCAHVCACAYYNLKTVGLATRHPSTEIMETVKLILFAGAAVSLFTAGANESYYKEVYPPVHLTGDLSNHLFFALIQSFGSEFNGSGNIAGIKVALDKINNRSDILANHTLHYTLTDSKVRGKKY